MNDFYSLDSILKEMIYSRKTNPSVYQKFSSLLISDKKEFTIEFVMNSMISCFIPNQTEELVFCDPNSVSSFFVNLCHEYSWIIEHQLIHTETKKRYRMVLILRSLFSLKKDLPTINIARELLTEKTINIWHSFLKRFTDVEPQIRIVCVKTAEVLLQTQIDELIISNMSSNLSKRFRDFDQTIRSDCAQVVHEVDNSPQADNILDHYLMKQFVARIGDKVFEVRKRVLICVSNVFHSIVRRYPKTEQNFFYKLSSACLYTYPTIQSQEEKALIEMIFTTNLIDLSEDNSTKAHNLIKLICFCDYKSVQTISLIFHNQIKLRTVFLNLIEALERHKFKKSIINVDNRIAKKLFESFEYIGNSDDVIKNFHHLLKSYSTKVNILRKVFECRTGSCRQSIDIIEEFFTSNQSVVNRELLLQLKDEVIARTGVALFDSNTLIHLLKHIKAVDLKFASRLASLVILLSKTYAEYFNEESIVSQLLVLPPLVIAYIASDSMLPFMKCSPNMKEKIKHFVIENINQINESIAQMHSDLSFT